MSVYVYFLSSGHSYPSSGYFFYPVNIYQKLFIVRGEFTDIRNHKKPTVTVTSPSVLSCNTLQCSENYLKFWVVHIYEQTNWLPMME